jgi:ribosomal protein L32
MIKCSSCGADTPGGHFCIRCGAPLGQGHEERSRTRSHYAAAPHEHVALPALVSSLFPHLPRSSHWGFRIALLSGAGLLVVLAATRLFPVGLIAAAVFLPLIVVLYVIDVDVYEDEPAWAMALSLAWGAVAGVGFGLIAVAVSPSITSVISNGHSQYLVWQGLVLPFLGLLVLMIGPLVLLRYHRFNSVLDGVAFGLCAGAAFAGAQLIAYSAHVLGDGIRPNGAVAPWIWRLLSFGVGLPIATMGAAAAVSAALWLRYRAPARDAEALGPVGHPVVALPVAALLVMGASVGEVFLPAGGWLAWLAAFDVVVLVLLRRAIHVGLLEESLEIPIGPDITCPNCGHQTARHTFCGSCGISLQALPKARRDADAAAAGASPSIAPTPEPGT